MVLFLERNGIQISAYVPGMYSLLPFESLHAFSLFISKTLEKSFLIYLSSALAAASWRTSLLRACSLFLTGIRRPAGTEPIIMRFSKEEFSPDLTGHYTSNVIEGMLGVEDFLQVDYVFPS